MLRVDLPPAQAAITGRGGCGRQQAGIETYSLALFFTTQEDLANLKKTAGFNLGTAPCLTIADKGLARELSFYTLRGVRAFAFRQKGLLGALGLQATKISRYTPSR